MEQGRIEGFAVDTCFAQCRLDSGIALDQRRFVQPIPADERGTRLAYERKQFLERGARAQAEGVAVLAQLRIQRVETVVQPPATRGTGRPGRLFVRRVDVEGNDRIAAFDGGKQGRIVGQPQVAPVLRGPFP